MEIHEHVLPVTNKLLEDYIGNGLHRSSYFHYSPYNEQSYIDRIEELKQYHFPRNEMVAHLLSFNEKYNADIKSIENIRRLEQPDSLVVIGGQQAGILTGPLYTINKIITIIQQAKRLEDDYQIPVIPVFWIAGEDHDFPEINHTYSEVNGKMKKHSLDHKWPNKHSVSDVQLDQKACKEWIDELFSFYGETTYTNEILHKIDECLKQSETYTDFFAQLIFLLFRDTGLVLVDSGNKQLRKLEIPFFKQFIEGSQEINKTLQCQQNRIRENDHHIMIEGEENSAHIFYHLNGERILLERIEKDGIEYFQGKHNECYFSKNELIRLLDEQPENFSNNVVTRPLMQEHLFPTIMFVAGPGEVAYWAELKGVFEVMGRKMPPVFPRLMLTLMNGSVWREINELQLSFQRVLSIGVVEEKEQFLRSLENEGIKQEITKMKKLLADHYKTLSDSASEIHDSLVQIVSKNETIIHRQFDYLEMEFFKQAQRKNDVMIQKYDRIQHLVRPENHPQERMLNVFYFINMYGFNLVKNMLEETTSSEYTHKLLLI
ncbi:bacillithiol biosynthesis cysteine-adding enzyme BshC [Bacillus sp. AK128]